MSTQQFEAVTEQDIRAALKDVASYRTGVAQLKARVVSLERDWDAAYIRFVKQHDYNALGSNETTRKLALEALVESNPELLGLKEELRSEKIKLIGIEANLDNAAAKMSAIRWEIRLRQVRAFERQGVDTSYPTTNNVTFSSGDTGFEDAIDAIVTRKVEALLNGMAAHGDVGKMLARQVEEAVNTAVAHGRFGDDPESYPTPAQAAPAPAYSDADRKDDTDLLFGDQTMPAPSQAAPEPGNGSGRVRAPVRPAARSTGAVVQPAGKPAHVPDVDPPDLEPDEIPF